MPNTKHFGSGDKKIKCSCCSKGDLELGLYVVLEHVRNHFNKPVVINSGARCRDYHNAVYKRLGQTPTKNSDHIVGEGTWLSRGVDISIAGVTPKQVYDFLDASDFSNILALGKYSWGVHIGLRASKARW